MREGYSDAASQPSSICQSCGSEPASALPYPKAKLILQHVASTQVSCLCCPFWAFPSKESGTEHSRAGCRTFYRVEINRTLHAVSPRFLDLEETLKSSSPVCHFTDENTELPTLNWAAQ